MGATAVRFDIVQLFKDAWELFKNNVSPLLGGYLVAMVVISASGLVYIGPLVLSGPLMLGMFKMARLAVNGEPVEFSELFSGFQRFLDAFVANLLTTLFTVIGMVFCIIPGLFIGLMYMLTYLFMHDDKLAFWDAMEASRRTVMNNPVQWILLWLALCLFNLLGVLVCCVGLILTGPVSLLVVTLAYDAERRAAVPVMAPVEPPHA
jgi:uncharacterized membrane protein